MWITGHIEKTLCTRLLASELWNDFHASYSDLFLSNNVSSALDFSNPMQNVAHGIDVNVSEFNSSSRCQPYICSWMLPKQIIKLNLPAVYVTSITWVSTVCTKQVDNNHLIHDGNMYLTERRFFLRVALCSPITPTFQVHVTDDICV